MRSRCHPQSSILCVALRARGGSLASLSGLCLRLLTTGVPGGVLLALFPRVLYVYDRNDGPCDSDEKFRNDAATIHRMTRDTSVETTYFWPILVGIEVN